jgi:tetratricopeptide (TPR) repeat protein
MDRRRLGRVCPWLFAILTMLLAASGWCETAAEAEQTSEQQAVAEQRFSEGAQAYKQGRYREAIELFKQADVLSPSAPLSFNIAQAYERMNDGRGALAWYRDYLRRSPTGPKTAEVAARVRELGLELERLGVQQLTVLSDPPGATVSIDGAPRGVTPYTDELAPGEHYVTLEKSGYEASGRSVHLAAHEALDLRVRLVPKKAPATDQPGTDEQPMKSSETSAEGAAASQEPRSDAANRSPRIAWWTWTTLGVSAALLASAGAVELSRRGLESDVENQGEQIAYRRGLESLDRRQTTAQLLLGVGAAVGIAGGVLLYFDLSQETEQMTLALSPGQLRLEGRF